MKKVANIEEKIGNRQKDETLKKKNQKKIQKPKPV